MKKLCVWALAAMMTVGATGAMADHLDDIKAKGKLVVGSEVSFAPFEFYFVGEDGKEYEAGFEMELARQIAADIGVELEVSDQQFNGLIPALRRCGSRAFRHDRHGRAQERRRFLLDLLRRRTAHRRSRSGFGYLQDR